MRDLSRIRRAVLTEPWAIMPRKLEAIIGVLEAATEGDVSAAAAGLKPAKVPELETIEGIPIVPIIGVISKRMNLFSSISGGTSIDRISKMFDEAMEMDSRAIILHIDSPGGSVSGVPEFASKVFEAAESTEKTIVAFADGTAASAAYWIGSQAHDFYTSEAGVIGSIGVIATLYDDTRRMQNEGIDPTIIRSSELKAAGAGPMSDNQWDAVKREVTSYFDMFKAAVARGRKGIDIEAVASGDVWIGQQAVQMGLADGVSTLERLAARYKKIVDKPMA